MTELERFVESDEEMRLIILLLHRTLVRPSADCCRATGPSAKPEAELSEPDPLIFVRQIREIRCAIFTQYISGDSIK
jgi:hypothetical protein